MSHHDPGAHTNRRNHSFLPYYWRTARRWADTAWDTTASYGIIGAVVIVMFAATLAVVILQLVLGDTPITTQVNHNIARFVIACVIILIGRALWNLFFR